MKIIDKTFTFMQKLLGAAILSLVIAACSSNSNMAQAAGSLTVDQLDALLAKSPTFSALAAKVGITQTDITALQAKQTADEKLLAQVALIGHSPGAGIDSLGRRTMAFHPGGIGVVTAAVDFGTCSNMGTLIGFSAPNPAAAQVAFFKTCTGYWYGVYADDTSTHSKGDIFQPNTIWFTDSTCGADHGDAIMLSEGGVNKLAGQAGYGFMSPVDGTTEYAIAQGSTPTSMTSGSAFVAGSGCTVDVETQPGYTLAPNSVTTTGIPVAAPSDFTL